MQDQAIGFFDSGWGGLSIFNAAREALPHENFIYVADCGHAPYGDQTHSYIVERALKIADFLFNHNRVKALVIACNTATVEAIKTLRETYPDKIILGVEPAIKPAVEHSKTHCVGMISTTRTAHSARYQELLKAFAADATVYSQGCPGLMECVERGELETPATIELLHTYLDPMIEGRIDALVLGCTHYPFLMPAIRSIVGEGVAFYEPGPAVAKHLKHQLDNAHYLTARKALGDDAFYVSDLTEERKIVAKSLTPSATTFYELPC